SVSPEGELLIELTFRFAGLELSLYLTRQGVLRRHQVFSHKCGSSHPSHLHCSSVWVGVAGPRLTPLHRIPALGPHCGKKTPAIGENPDALRERRTATISSVSCSASRSPVLIWMSPWSTTDPPTPAVIAAASLSAMC